jgi:hypothetical protein
MRQDMGMVTGQTMDVEQTMQADPDFRKCRTKACGQWFRINFRMADVHTNYVHCLDCRQDMAARMRRPSGALMTERVTQRSHVTSRLRDGFSMLADSG